MRKAMALFVVILMLSLFNMANAEKTNDVQIDFQSGFGIRILVYNPNDYSIYTLSLDKIDISGILVFGVSPGVIGVNEVSSHSSTLISFLVFGFGGMYVTAYLSYVENGETVNKEVHCQALVIGSIVIILDQW